MPKRKQKKPGLLRFFIVLGIVLVYLVISSLQFGFKNGIEVTALSWSFFVFCTPIADAGLLLDFPVRLVIGLRMIYTELFVWILALIINLLAISLNSAIYNKTPLLVLFHDILTTPWPLGLIIVLSGIGTFLSIFLGDHAYDIVAAKNRKAAYRTDIMQIYFSVSVFIVTGVLYFVLLHATHTKIKVF